MERNLPGTPKSIGLVLTGALIGVIGTVGYLHLNLNFFTDLGLDNIPKETVNTVLGVVLGFLASTVLHLYLNRRRETRRALSLRKAFLSELEAMNQFFEILNEGVNYEHTAAEKMTGMISTQVYDSNAQQIGSLTPNEVQNLATFYASVENITTLMETAAASNEENIPDGMVPSRESQLHLNTMWLLSIRALRENLPEDEQPPQPDLIDIREEWQQDINEQLSELLGKEVTAEELIEDIDQEFPESG